jgi:hypothetical protein
VLLAEDGILTAASRARARGTSRIGRSRSSAIRSSGLVRCSSRQ